MNAYRTVLVGVEFSPTDAIALDAAAAIAERANTERIHLIHGVQIAESWPIGATTLSGSAFEAMIEAARTGAEQRIDQIEVARTSARVTRAVRIGPPSREIAAEADEIDADLIVLGTHDRRGLARVALGSVMSSVLRTSAHPMLIVGKDRPNVRRIRHVLAAIDLSPISKSVLRHAFKIARMYEGSVAVLSLYTTAFPIPEIERALFAAIAVQLDDVAERYRAEVEALVAEVRDPAVETRIEVASKAPARNAILDVAGLLESDLIVVGTSGRNAWHRFFVGSTATHVVREAPCPVLAIPHREARRATPPAPSSGP
jgi:nucleotide-binding universal stress UspA family protein